MSLLKKINSFHVKLCKVKLFLINFRTLFSFSIAAKLKSYKKVFCNSYFHIICIDMHLYGCLQKHLKRCLAKKNKQFF